MKNTILRNLIALVVMALCTFTLAAANPNVTANAPDAFNRIQIIAPATAAVVSQTDNYADRIFAGYEKTGWRSTTISQPETIKNSENQFVTRSASAAVITPSPPEKRPDLMNLIFTGDTGYFAHRQIIRRE